MLYADGTFLSDMPASPRRCTTAYKAAEDIEGLRKDGILRITKLAVDVMHYAPMRYAADFSHYSSLLYCAKEFCNIMKARTGADIDNVGVAISYTFDGGDRSLVPDAMRVDARKLLNRLDSIVQYYCSRHEMEKGAEQFTAFLPFFNLVCQMALIDGQQMPVHAVLSWPKATLRLLEWQGLEVLSEFRSVCVDSDCHSERYSLSPTFSGINKMRLGTRED